MANLERQTVIVALPVPMLSSDFTEVGNGTYTARPEEPTIIGRNPVDREGNRR